MEGTLRFIIALLLVLPLLAASGGENVIVKQTSNSMASRAIAFSANADTTKPLKEKYFPFRLQELDGQYIISADIEGKKLYPEYYNLFAKYGYEGNGYCWEGHITQILEKIDKNLLAHITFDSEAGAFFANADSRKNQLKFVALLSPIFSDVKELEKWIRKAERSRIDD